MKMLRADVEHVSAREGRSPREQEVPHGAHGVEIAPFVHALGHRERFGSEVQRCPDELVRILRAGAPEVLHEPEI